MQEGSKIYCLCRQPYDELRPMLSCDYCNDWFHYDCIGLLPPGDNEDDDEVAPEEYRCPKCCIQVFKPFWSYQVTLPGVRCYEQPGRTASNQKKTCQIHRTVMLLLNMLAVMPCIAWRLCWSIEAHTGVRLRSLLILHQT